MDSGHSLVADLIEHNLHQWKESTVRRLFSEDQALHILNMPIPSVDTPDKIIWRADRSGSYSVRSGYRLLIGATEGISTSPASHYEDEIKSLYRSLWSLPLPQKIKIAFWRFTKNFIPTSVNLSNRRMNINTSCTLCNLEVESVEHLFLSCPFSHHVLAGLGVDLPLITADQNWLQWLASVFKKLSCYQRKLLIVSFWAIWFMQNKKKHEGTQESAWQTINFISTQMREFEAVAVRVDRRQKPLSRWMPPRSGTIKANFDASIDATRHSSVARIVIRNSEGLIMGACTFPFLHVSNVEMVEARACEKAVSLCKDLGFRNVVIEGDALTVINKINKIERDNSEIWALVANIHLLKRNFESITFNYVNRLGNNAAHILAKEGRLFSFPKIWIEDTPPKVEEVAQKDINQST
ncbi:hypothetical protein V6N13_115912 [Hibiscus sabdariffa]|uniref:Reverse transcriptase n=1 Tax=Hibiscus sabdariffa TaxID=183260 RepID=A0ABR2QSA9_9ROSI